MYLAIGVMFQKDVSWSILTDTVDPEIIAKKLGSVDSWFPVPDRILLVDIDPIDKTPTILYHWSLGKDYQGS